MRSVADLFRAEDREELQTLTPAERGARDLETFHAAQRPPLDPAEAARVLERRRQAGRRRSRCVEELIG